MRKAIHFIRDLDDIAVARCCGGIRAVSEIRGYPIAADNVQGCEAQDVVMLSHETMERIREQGPKNVVFSQVYSLSQRGVRLIFVHVEKAVVTSDWILEALRCFPFLFDRYVPLSFATPSTLFVELEGDEQPKQEATFAGATKTNYEERFAKYLLESWQPERYRDLAVSGRAKSPDLIAPDNSVGIEVTNALPSQFIHRLNDTTILRELPADRVGRYLRDWTRHYVENDGTPRIEFSPQNIAKAIKRKSSRLNSESANYANTETNELYITHEVPALTHGRWKHIIPAVEKQRRKMRYFSMVYVFCADAMYVYELKESDVEVRRIPIKELSPHIRLASERAWEDTRTTTEQ